MRNDNNKLAARAAVILAQASDTAATREAPAKTREQKQAELKARQQAAYTANLRGRLRWEDTSKYVAHDLGERRKKEC